MNQLLSDGKQVRPHRRGLKALMRTVGALVAIVAFVSLMQHGVAPRSHVPVPTSTIATSTARLENTGRTPNQPRTSCQTTRASTRIITLPYRYPTLHCSPPLTLD
jgi:hypothetical protein